MIIISYHSKWKCVSCSALSDPLQPMHYSPPNSSDCGSPSKNTGVENSLLHLLFHIPFSPFPLRISFSRPSFQPRDRTPVSCIADRFKSRTKINFSELFFFFFKSNMQYVTIFQKLPKWFADLSLLDKYTVYMHQQSSHLGSQLML